jgi:hypothetical protein
MAAASYRANRSTPADGSYEKLSERSVPAVAQPTGMRGPRYSKPTAAQARTINAICIARGYEIDAREAPVLDPVSGAYRLSLQRKLPSERPLVLLIHQSGSYMREERQ